MRNSLVNQGIGRARAPPYARATCLASSLRATGACTCWRWWLVAAAAVLGVWQYDAWQERRAAEARRPDPARADPAGRRDRAGRPVPGRQGRAAGDHRGHLGPGRHGLRVRPASTTAATATGSSPRSRRRRPDGPALPVVRGWVAEPGRRTPRRRPGPPSWSAGSSRPRAPARRDPDPDDDVLPQLRIADLVQRVDQDLYGAYAVVADQDGVNDGTDGLEQATSRSSPTSGGSPPCATCSTRSSGGSSGPSRCSSGGAGCATRRPTPEPGRRPRPHPRPTARRACRDGWRGPVGWPREEPVQRLPRARHHRRRAARVLRPGGAAAEVPRSPRAATSSSSARPPASCGSPTAGSS